MPRAQFAQGPLELVTARRAKVMKSFSELRMLMQLDLGFCCLPKCSQMTMMTT